MNRYIVFSILVITTLLGGCSNEQSQTQDTQIARPEATENQEEEYRHQPAPVPVEPGQKTYEQSRTYDTQSAPRPSYDTQIARPEATENQEVTSYLPDATIAKPEYALVRAFFATDRSLTGIKKPSEMFGVGRATLKYGTCDVSIPRDHRMGELEEPSILRLEFREDPTKHVVLVATEITEKNEYFRQLSERVMNSKSKRAFLFVHGYNVTFEDAARRTAQIAYDLAFDGAPVFYSWPSQGSVPAYTVDEQNIEWAQSNIRLFLDDFFARSEAEEIYLIAHSMGNRALTRALANILKEKPDYRAKLQEVILAAPDIDADVFKKDIAPALTANGRPITLYASSEDKALKASKKVHGYSRAGDSGQYIVIVNGVETIDATNVNTSFLGHSYFAEDRSVLSDIYHLVRTRQRADSRFGLRPINSGLGRYWKIER